MKMKFQVPINYNKLVTALKMWNTGCDGEDGGTCKVMEEIPYPDALNQIVPWDSVVEQFDEAIGGRGGFDLEKIINGEIDEQIKFHDWATDRANRIVKVYEEVVKRANENQESFHAVIGFVLGDWEDYVNYGVPSFAYRVIRGSTKKECINAVWDFCNGKDGTCFKDKRKFCDAMYKAAEGVEDGEEGKKVHLFGNVFAFFTNNPPTRLHLKDN